MGGAFYNSFHVGLGNTDDIMSRELQDILMHHWLFGVLPGRTIADLSHQFSSKRYKNGQFIFHQDDPADRLYVILDGEVSIETYNLDGAMTKITHLHGGEIFGEFALIDDQGRSASTCVVKSATVASLSGKIFHKLLEDYPEFSKKLLQVLVSRMRSSNDQITSLVTLNLLQRTARLLQKLYGIQGSEIKITQTAISERLFASREKVNVKLKELEQMGAIETGHGRISVKNADVFSNLLDPD